MWSAWLYDTWQLYESNNICGWPGSVILGSFMRATIYVVAWQCDTWQRYESNNICGWPGCMILGSFMRATIYVVGLVV